MGDLVFCVALPEEAKIIRRALQSCDPVLRDRVSIITTGMGAERAARHIGKRLDTVSAHQPAAVILSGFAGGLNPELKAGSAVIHSERSDIFPEWGDLSGLCDHTGRYYSSTRIIGTPAEKSELFNQTGHDAVDMESAGILEACEKFEVPATVVKAISDEAGEHLPVDFTPYIDKNGFISYSRLIGGLSVKPQQLPSMLKLARKSSLCSNRLIAIFSQWIPQFLGKRV